MWGRVSPLNTKISGLFLNMSQAVDRDLLKKIEIPELCFPSVRHLTFSLSSLTSHPHNNIIIYILYFIKKDGIGKNHHVCLFSVMYSIERIMYAKVFADDIILHVIYK